MKKAISLVLAAAFIFALAGCAPKADSQTQQQIPQNRLEAIKQRGYIEVATEPYFAPYEFIDSSKSGDEKYVGMDIEIGKYIADSLGVELRIVPLEFSAVQASVAEGKYDLAISALAYTPVRAEAMEMSKGYYFSDQEEAYGVLVKEEDIDRFKTAEDFKDAVIVMQSASVQEIYVTEQIKQAKEFKRVSATTDGFLMVSEGKADACACAVANGQLYADANPGVVIANTFRFTADETTQGTRIAAPKGETELIEYVNGIIDTLMETGKTKEWYQEYAEYASSLGV